MITGKLRSTYAVDCRIGSLEINKEIYAQGTDVDCRIGSLEKKYAIYKLYALLTAA